MEGYMWPEEILIDYVTQLIANMLPTIGSLIQAQIFFPIVLKVAKVKPHLRVCWQ